MKPPERKDTTISDGTPNVNTFINDVNKNVNSMGDNSQRQTVLRLLSEGATIGQISLLTGKCKSSVYRLISRMKKQGILTKENEPTIPKNAIENKGKPNVNFSPSHQQNVNFSMRNYIRLHNVHITVKILDKPHKYDYRKNNLVYFKVRQYKHYQLKSGTKEQYLVNKVLIRTNTDSIEIFPNEIYAKTEKEATKALMDIVFNVIPKIENLYKILLIKENYLNIRISKQHYALIQNQLATYYKNERKGDVFRVYDEKDGKVRLVIDFSLSPEFEAEHVIKSPSDINKCQNYFKDIIHRSHDLPSDTKTIVHQLADQQHQTVQIQQGIVRQQQTTLHLEAQHAKNIKNHLQVLENINNSFKRFNRLLSQKKLGEWL